MLTMHNKPECVEIATLYENEQDKKGTPIYWYPKKDPLLKLGVDDVESYLKSPEFRDEYRLSKAAAAAISTALIKGEDVPEEKGLNNKFFEIKKDLENIVNIIKDFILLSVVCCGIETLKHIF